MKNHMLKITTTAVLVTLLSSCAIGPDYQRPATNANTAWVAPLPHDGKPASLVNWWSQWDDQVLVELIDNAMRENTSVAQAAARIAQSRANYRSLTSLLFPAFTANASDTRSKGDTQQQGGQSGQVGQGGQPNAEQRIRNLSLDAAWELDVVGGARRGREAAALRLDAREADWHDAKVMIAGEVAMQYVNLRTCEVLLAGYDIDTKSRVETARLTNLKRDAGFEAPANAALVNASASEANARYIQQRAECDLIVKTLAELTATSEPLLRVILEKKRAVLPVPKTFAINQIPAEAISQRPDVASAERELAASMADIGLAIADRFPRISLTGVIGYQQFSTGGVESNGRTWRFGPAITLPIFDAGRRAANVDAARARYDEQLAAYKGKTLRAVREVEDSLVRLDSAAKREADANAALIGYQKFLNAAEAKVKVGAGSLTELEDARRAVVAAQGAAVGVARERLTAWIGLYKAVGGGWVSS
jgi:outer membrane protein, multidrug efflux system